MKIKKIGNKIEEPFVNIVLCGAIIFLMIAALAGFIGLYTRADFMNTKAYISFLGSLFFLLILAELVWLFQRIVSCCSNGKRIFLRVFLFLSIFVFQMICLNGLGKITLTEDSFKVIDMASNMVYNTKGMLDNTIDEPVYGGYFARYSNNHGITLFFYYFFSMLRFFGCEQFILAARILNVILLDLGIFLTYLSARKMWGSRKADIVLLLMALSPTTYVWLFWSYTNTFSIPFVMGILLLYLYGKDSKENKKVALHGMCMAVVGVIGYFIRPTTIIPIIAVIIMQFFSLQWGGKVENMVDFFPACFYSFSRECESHKWHTFSR